jgi:hypothetical protein
MLLLGVALAVSLVAGCSKHSSDAGTPQSVNLGTVELSPGQPSRNELGGGNVCVITGTPLGADNLELIVVLEKSGRKLASTRRAPTPADRPLQVSLGSIQIELIPHMK